MNWTRMWLIVALAPGMILFGDPVEEALGAGATEQLKAHTRAMIQAGMDANGTIGLTRSLAEHGVGSPEIIRIQESVMSAFRSGLPAGPLVAKVHEGLGKGVPGQEIARAVEALRARYDFAYGRAASITAVRGTGLGDRIADALSAGLSERDADRILERLRVESASGELAEACYHMARVMAGYRVVSGTVADVVCQALDAGFRMQDMERLRFRFTTRARSAGALQAAAECSRAIRGEGTPGGSAGVGSPRSGSGTSQAGNGARGSSDGGPAGKGQGGKGLGGH